MSWKSNLRTLSVRLFLTGMLSLSPSTALADVSTREDREALFNYVFEKTMEREAFSPIKNERLGLDIAAAMRALKDEVVNAQTDEDLFYALVKLSNTRKDRHLKVGVIDGGLKVKKSYNISANSNYPEYDQTHANRDPTAPVKFYVDYGTENYFLFLSDFSRDIAKYAGKNTLTVGDKLISVNGVAIGDYIEKIRPYFRYSTEKGYWVKMALALNQKTPILPEKFYKDDFTVGLENRAGKQYTLKVPYLPADKIDWIGYSQRKYRNFELLMERETFDLYRNTAGKRVLLLAWKGFGGTLVEDMDQLMEFAEKHGYLDYDIIWHGTRSRGGSRGAYAIQRLSSKPFKTTFGNLRLSDVIPAFVAEKRRQYEQRKVNDRGARETIDDGSWLMDWLENDILNGYKRGQAYSNNVPFKTAHLPKYSDGILQPAKVHFTGTMVCLLGPYGGSHLDQFASIVVDNDLCYTMGMPAGGYSNTYEWEEDLKFPISGKPVVRYMWSIGQTIRPNGEVLEGNPAEVKEYIPVTRDNFVTYYDILLSRALEVLSEN